MADCRLALHEPVGGVQPSDHYGVLADLVPATGPAGARGRAPVGAMAGPNRVPAAAAAEPGASPAGSPAARPEPSHGGGTVGR